MDYMYSIEEMKCPYCGDVDAQDYGDMFASDYSFRSHYVIWRNDCLICKRSYFYTEEYEMVSATSTKEEDED